MNRRQEPQSFRSFPPAYRRAFARLDAFLEANAESDYSARLELIGRHMFGEYWRPKQPDQTPETAP